MNELPTGYKWSIIGYLHGRHLNKCPRKFEDFEACEKLAESGSYTHFITKCGKVLVCVIVKSK